MNSGRIRWLYGELPDLVRQGILDPEAAESIRGHYGAVPEISARRILFVTFGALGALLIGAGIILVLGHNWNELSRPVRAGLCFALLIVGQVAAAWAVIRKPDSAAWNEAAGGFLPMALMASLALLAQTYNIAGEPHGLLATTVALSLPVAYLLRSRVAMALCWVLAVQWFLLPPWPDENVGRFVTFGAFVALCVPFLVWLRFRHHDDVRTPLLGWVVSGAVVIATIRPASVAVAAPLFAGLLASLYVLGLRRDEGAAAWRRPSLVIGALGIGVTMVACGFQESWSHVAGISEQLDTGTARLVAALAVAMAIPPAVVGIGALRDRAWGAALLAMTPLAVSAAWVTVATGADPLAAAILVNLWGLAIGLTVCVEGARSGRLGTANAGLLLMLAILMTRFFDVDISFVGRGIAFIVIGAGFLALNVRMLGRRREVTS